MNVYFFASRGGTRHIGGTPPTHPERLEEGRAEGRRGDAAGFAYAASVRCVFATRENNHEL